MARRGERIQIYSNTGIVAARMAGDSVHFGRFAHDLRATVQRQAASNIDTSNFVNSIEVARRRGRSGSGRGVWDRLVYSTDSGALSIEYGRAFKSADGTVVSHTPGQYPFRKAIRKMS